MADQLQVGMTFEKTITVTESVAAQHLAGQGIGVFSTPELVRFVEICALEGVRPFSAARPGYGGHQGGHHASGRDSDRDAGHRQVYAGGD